MTKPSRIFAIEEHVAFDGIPAPERRDLFDIDGARLDHMDRNGIDMQVLSLTVPGVGKETDADKAVDMSREINDRLAEIVAARPDRFQAFACLPSQVPDRAAQELRRAVSELGLKGAMINGDIQGNYLDAPMFAPIWESLEALDVPLYLHPGMAHQPWSLLEGYPELRSAAWGWSCETGGHALRIIRSGVFDRHPGVRMILGHMGESIPLYFKRIDRAIDYVEQKTGGSSRPPSTYFRSNIVITTSGTPDDLVLNHVIASMGAERVLYAADYPFEADGEPERWLKALDIAPDDLEAIAHGNATRELKL